MSPERFAQRIRAIGDGVRTNAGNLVRKVAVAIDQTVVLGTPVDTGRARSNWQVSLDNPADGTRAAFSPGTEQSTSGANARAAIAEGRATIAKHQDGQAIHITNNLPYIGRLNDGWSAQAPAGFVQDAVVTAARAIKGARLVIRDGETVVRKDF